MFRRNIIATLVLVMTAVVGSYAQGFTPNLNSPYPVAGPNPWVRSFANPNNNLAPQLFVDGAYTYFGYYAGYRTDSGEAKIFIAFTEQFKSGQAKFETRFTFDNPWAGPSTSPTDNNLMVIALGLADGSTGRSLVEGVHNGNNVYAILHDGVCIDYHSQQICAPEKGTKAVNIPMDAAYPQKSEEFDLHVRFTEAENMLAFVGRPATTDSIPQAKMGVGIKTLEGTPAGAILGDNLVWMRQYMPSQLWDRVNQVAPRNATVYMPHLGRDVYVSGNEVKNFLRTLSPYSSETMRAMNASVLAQLQCWANGSDPRTTIVGQRYPLDPQLSRASALNPATAGDTVFHGGSPIYSLAVCLGRAYRSYIADPANSSDFREIVTFVNRITSV